MRHLLYTLAWGCLNAFFILQFFNKSMEPRDLLIVAVFLLVAAIYRQRG